MRRSEMKKERLGVIYKATLPGGKVYVGRTTRGSEEAQK